MADITANDIKKKDLSTVPEFVNDVEKRLSQKRRVEDSRAYTTTEYFGFGKTIIKTYFDSPETTATSSASADQADQLELLHLAHISAIDDNDSPGNQDLFKEAGTNWLFFTYFAMHLSRRTELNEPPIITTKFGHEPWPLSLIITFEGNKFTYTPRSDFLVLRRTLPRMAVEVNSGRPQQDVLGYGVLDHRRLMLQGASIVRLANQYLDTYKEEKNFFFVAIYIGHNGEAMRHIMYQTMDSPTVYCKNQKFDLKKSESRAQFVLELYNFASVLDAEHDDEVVADQVEGFNNKVNGHPMFKFTDSTTTGNASRATSKGTSKGKGDNRGNQDHPKDDSGRAMEQEEQLKAHGYIVVPDILETDGGTWELLTKPPPHVRIVYRQGDPNKTEMISKAVREASREPDILNFLRMTGRVSPHVISLIETITSATRKWLILPKMLSIDQRFMNHAGVGARSALGRGLIEGLAYLHEHNIAHRDIKPDNLVCDSNCRLQIIDFDVALQVQDENTLTDKYRGTKGWTAPEMGKGKQDEPTSMHSPIRADRWSCGRVLQEHIKVFKEDKCLAQFAVRLMAIVPRNRPSLLEWVKRSVTSDATSRPRQREELGESNCAKRAKHDHDTQPDQRSGSQLVQRDSAWLVQCNA